MTLLSTLENLEGLFNEKFKPIIKKHYEDNPAAIINASGSWQYYGDEINTFERYLWEVKKSIFSMYESSIKVNEVLIDTIKTINEREY